MTKCYSFQGSSTLFSREMFIETMLKLVKLAGTRIKDEMKRTKGAIMSDGWTANGTHFIGVFAVYMRTVQVLVQGVVREKQDLSLPLISVS